jgi:Domain of unknown function (DUF4124)
MSMRAARIALGLLLASVALLPPGAQAGEKNPVSAYRWVDDQGVVHYGDSIPPQYAEKAHEMLNKQGVEVGHTEAQKTPEELAVEARERADALKRQQHDNFLVTTYTSVKDIESLRDVRLDQLQGQRVAAEAYVENLHSRLAALQDRAKHFRPYNRRADARKMPDDLAEDLVRTLNELRTQSNALTAKNEEVLALKAQFQMDIERYRELHDAHLKR